MTLKYKLIEGDFLLLTLYLLKKDETLKKANIKRTLVQSTIALAIILILYFDHQLLFAVALLIGLIIGLIIRPLRLKEKYFDSCKKQAKLYASVSNSNNEFNLNEDFVEVKSENVDVKRTLTEIKSIVETQKHFFILCNIGYIIIPKLKIENIGIVRDEFVSLSKKMNIEYISDLIWKW